MTTITPYHPVIIETARRFNSVHMGATLAEMISDVGDNCSSSVFIDEVQEDPSLMEGASELNVGFEYGSISYMEFIHYVAIAQKHILREGDEIDTLIKEITKNFKEEDQLVVKNKIMEIGESLGESENNFYNFLADLFHEVAGVKEYAVACKAPIAEVVRGHFSDIDFESTLTSGNYGFEFEPDSELLSDALGIIAWALDGPVNEIEKK